MKSVIAALFVSAIFASPAQAQNASDCAKLAALSDSFVIKFADMKETLDSNSYLPFDSVMRPGDEGVVTRIEQSKEALALAMQDFIDNHSTLSAALRRCAND